MIELNLSEWDDLKLLSVVMVYDKENTFCIYSKKQCVKKKWTPKGLWKAAAHVLTKSHWFVAFWYQTFIKNHSFIITESLFALIGLIWCPSLLHGCISDGVRLALPRSRPALHGNQNINTFLSEKEPGL